MKLGRKRQDTGLAKAGRALLDQTNAGLSNN
jgi:hypothetical protein